MKNAGKFLSKDKLYLFLPVPFGNKIYFLSEEYENGIGEMELQFWNLGFILDRWDEIYFATLEDAQKNLIG